VAYLDSICEGLPQCSFCVSPGCLVQIPAVREALLTQHSPAGSAGSPMGHQVCSCAAACSDRPRQRCHLRTAVFVGWTRAVSFVLRFGHTVVVTQVTMVASNNQTGTKRPPGARRLQRAALTQTRQCSLSNVVVINNQLDTELIQWYVMSNHRRSDPVQALLCSNAYRSWR
jgi:hypothetical protein